MTTDDVMTFDCDDALAAITKVMKPVPPSQRGRKGTFRKVGPGATADLSRFTVLVPHADLPPLPLLAEALDEVLNQVPDAKDEVWPPFAVVRVPADHLMMKKARDEGVTHEGNGWVLLSIDNALDRYFTDNDNEDEQRVGPYDLLLGLNIVHAEALLEVNESYVGGSNARPSGRSLADSPDSREARVYMMHTTGTSEADMHVTLHEGVDIDGNLTTTPVDTTDLAEQMAKARPADSLLGRLSRRALGENLPVVIPPRTLLNYLARYAFGNQLDPDQKEIMTTVFSTPATDLLTHDSHPAWTQIAAVLMETSSPQLQFFSHAAHDREATPELLMWAGPHLAVELTRPDYLTPDLSTDDDSECVDLEKARRGLWRLTALFDALTAHPHLSDELHKSFSQNMTSMNLPMEELASAFPSDELPLTFLYFSLANMLSCMNAPDGIPTIWWDSDFPLLGNTSSADLQDQLNRINADIATNQNCPDLVNDMMTLLTVTTDRYQASTSRGRKSPTRPPS